MKFRKTLLTLSIAVLASCGSDNKPSNDQPQQQPATPQQPQPQPQAESHTIVDPNTAAANRFGIKTLELSNGNIVIASEQQIGGAVHLYNPVTQTFIHSIYGETLGDFNNENGALILTALSNGNFVLSAPEYDVNGVTNGGKVMLINGNTGTQIGTAIEGDNNNDYMGGIVTALSNGNYVIGSPSDEVNGINDAGSVMLINGLTGVQIGTTIEGDNAGDRFGNIAATELTNGNFVIAADRDTTAQPNAGSIRLVNGTTGAIIGTPIVGDRSFDNMGGSGIFALENGNYVIASKNDDVVGFSSDGGTVILMNGNTGAQIGATLMGASNKRLGQYGVLPLANDEFLVPSPFEDVGGVLQAGTVRIYNANTGAQVGPTLSGSRTNDYFGHDNNTIQLSNGNIVIASWRANSANNTNVGSITLVNGTTKAVISTFSIDQADANLGRTAVKALNNGNYLIASNMLDHNGMANVGGVLMFNGTTGAQIGNTIYGDDVNDFLSHDGVTVLDNGNFVVASRYDNVNGIANAGSVKVFDGNTGAQLGTTITGNTASDSLSRDGIFTLTGSNNFVIASSRVADGSTTNVGSVILVNGDTGVQIGAADTGSSTDDLYGYDGEFSGGGIIPLANGNYLISAENKDDNGNTNTGTVLYRVGQ